MLTGCNGWVEFLFSMIKCFKLCSDPVITPSLWDLIYSKLHLFLCLYTDVRVIGFILIRENNNIRLSSTMERDYSEV